MDELNIIKLKLKNEDEMKKIEEKNKMVLIVKKSDKKKNVSEEVKKTV